MQNISPSCNFFRELLCADSTDGANLFAGAAVNTCIRIDLEMRITLGYSGNRAGFGAGTAGNAIVTDLVCHVMYLHKMKCFLCGSSSE